MKFNFTSMIRKVYVCVMSLQTFKKRFEENLMKFLGVIFNFKKMWHCCKHQLKSIFLHDVLNTSIAIPIYAKNFSHWAV